MKYLEHDRKIFQKLCELFPSDGSFYWIYEHGLDPYHTLNDLKDLEAFIDECKRPEFKFINAKLEALRAKLKKNLTILVVKSSLLRRKPTSREEDRKQDRLQLTVNGLTREMSKIYDKLIDMGREQLAINPS